MRSRFFAHPLGIDEQFVDHPGQPGEGEVERDRRVGADIALDRGVADVALVPQRDILQRRASRSRAPCGRGRSGSRSAPGCACAASPTSPSGRARNIPPPRAPRCAGDGGSRSPAARSSEAITPSVAKNIAWRSRGITWVETGSTARPIFAATCASTRGSILAKVPTAPEIAQVAISARAATSRARLRANSA